MILPEIGVALNRNHYACWGGDSLKEVLPKKCPCCGAGKVQGKPRYKCGAEYTSKPQGQTHTDVYWGICPARVNPEDAEKAGLDPLTPPGIVADKLEELGFMEDAEYVRKTCMV